MPSPSLQPLVDKLLGGDLEAFLASRKADGRSYRRMAIDLRERCGVDVTPETVRQWCLSLAERPEDAA